jgi:hypothetical protein
MEDDDVEAWNFYWRNAVPFVQDYGLMGERVRRLGLTGVAREIFEDKLSAIHNKKLERQVRDMKEDAEAGAKRKPGDITLVGSENG